MHELELNAALMDLQMADTAITAVLQAHMARELIGAESAIPAMLPALAYGTPVYDALSRAGGQSHLAMAYLEPMCSRAALDIAMEDAVGEIYVSMASLLEGIALEAGMLDRLPAQYRDALEAALKKGDKDAVGSIVRKMFNDKAVDTFTLISVRNEALSSHLPAAASDLASPKTLKDFEQVLSHSGGSINGANIKALKKLRGGMVGGAAGAAAADAGKAASAKVEAGAAASAQVGANTTKTIAADATAAVKEEVVHTVKAGGKELTIIANETPKAAEVVSKFGKFGKAAMALAGVALATKVGFYLSKSTVGAVSSMMATPLPNDEASYDAYVSKLVDIMNSKTNFRVVVGSEASDIKTQNVKIDLRQVEDMKAVHADAVKRFASIPGQLSALADKAKASGNPWQVKGVLILSQLTHVIISKATSGGGKSLAQRADALHG